jgi:hypothetical protein
MIMELETFKYSPSLLPFDTDLLRQNAWGHV